MIELDAVSFSYGGAPVLSGLSCSFEKGRFYAVLGPNGSGKTTLTRLIARLRQPQGGRLLLDGQPYCDYERRAFARKLALLPQSRPLPAIAVRELVSHGRFPHLDMSRRLSAEDRRIVEQAMETTSVTAFAGRGVGELSGGERQRVYLAMLLAQDTDYVLLDEPTTYLDISSQFSVMDNLRQISQSGKCVVAVLHDLSLALRYADCIMLLSGGVLHFSGSPEQAVRSRVLEEVFGVECIPVEHKAKTEYLLCPVEVQ